MPPDKRPRRSNCPISYATDIFGDAWTLLVLRDLLLFNRRHFSELQGMEEGIATNILADRLKRLEAYGVVVREPDPKDGRKTVYRPTDTGIALIPILLEISAWSLESGAVQAGPPDFCERFRANRDAVIAEFAGRHDEAD